MGGEHRRLDVFYGLKTNIAGASWQPGRLKCMSHICATADLNLAHWAMEMNQTIVALHPLSALCSVTVHVCYQINETRKQKPTKQTAETGIFLGDTRSAIL